jgi:hypothetical protein
MSNLLKSVEALEDRSYEAHRLSKSVDLKLAVDIIPALKLIENIFKKITSSPTFRMGEVEKEELNDLMMKLSSHLHYESANPADRESERAFC